MFFFHQRGITSHKLLTSVLMLCVWGSLLERLHFLEEPKQISGSVTLAEDDSAYRSKALQQKETVPGK